MYAQSCTVERHANWPLSWEFVMTLAVDGVLSPITPFNHKESIASDL